ncbi:DUF3530 domain-containing protein [Zobellella endophytica]|uniref:DUF3530 domain-containing protein n=1 Tax=Zobellella endophytica TaxID=2116700 RepID=A0A2P7R194_9GAMM|nr:DUF3530 family protein [Zobellella endophytica]PSJ43973.1 DUF3530 domain-containing protein [Zobellella endophytica]
MARTGWRAGILILLSLLGGSAAWARLDWTAFEQYRSPSALLYFETPRPRAEGSLLIWPELSQPHLWLAMAEYWQRKGWDFILLLPDASQQAFDPATEAPSPVQRQWLVRQGERLQDALADTDPERRLLVLVQGSAALWYQQLVDGGTLSTPDALVVFDAHPRPSAQQRMLAISLARSPYPVLDIDSRPREPLSRLNQQRRRQQSEQQEKADYQMELLTGHALLERQIAGWLVRLGWLPLPPGAPDYLKGKRNEAGISRPTDPGPGR